MPNLPPPPSNTPHPKEPPPPLPRPKWPSWEAMKPPRRVYNRENLVGPFLEHKILGPRHPPPPHPLKHKPGPSFSALRLLSSSPCQLPFCLPPPPPRAARRLASEMQMCKALQFLKYKKYNKAIDALKAFEKKDKQLKAKAATNLSYLYFLEGDIENGQKYADMSIATDKYNAKALVNRGNFYYVKQEYDKAKELYMDALAVEADCIEAMYNLGVPRLLLVRFTRGTGAGRHCTSEFASGNRGRGGGGGGGAREGAPQGCIGGGGGGGQDCDVVLVPFFKETPMSEQLRVSDTSPVCSWHGWPSLSGHPLCICCRSASVAVLYRHWRKAPRTGHSGS